MNKIESPCENICIVDRGCGLCLGCGRSLSEIERWTGYSEDTRLHIMSKLPARLASLRTRGAVRTKA